MMEEVVKKRLLEFRGNREALTDEYFNKLSELYQIICQMYQAVKNTGKDHQLLQVIKLVDFIYGDDTKERLKEISQEENNIGFYVAIYGVYKKTDLDQYRKLKVNGKSYFYLKGRLEINEQLFEELKAVPNQETRIFVEHVHGQLVFT